MNCEIERWKSIDVSNDDFTYSDILQARQNAERYSDQHEPAATGPRIGQPTASPATLPERLATLLPATMAPTKQSGLVCLLRLGYPDGNAILRSLSGTPYRDRTLRGLRAGT